MNPHQILEQLYRGLSEHPRCSPARRALWQAMAEDETHDIVTLERSSYVCDVIDHPPDISDDMLARVEAVVASAEALVQNPDLTEDEAVRQALHLESSELNGLEGAWLRGFRITTGLLLRALAPNMQSHIYGVRRQRRRFGCARLSLALCAAPSQSGVTAAAVQSRRTALKFMRHGTRHSHNIGILSPCRRAAAMASGYPASA